MSLFESAARHYGGAGDDTDTDADQSPGDSATTARAGTRKRAATVSVAGEEIDLEEIETSQPDDEGTWLTGTDSYGRPRGIDALEMRQIVQTSAMQAIVNGVASNIVGGDLVAETVDDVMDDLSEGNQQAAADLRRLVMDVVTGPHLQNESLDDLIVAAIEDMMGPGEGVWQLIGSADGSLPVAAMTTLDPLTVRKNIDRHGVWGEPAYYQATSAFSGGSIGSLQSIDPTPLQQDEVAVMSYPLGNRSYQGPYPVSPAWQIREWLEILANSTQHHNRFYADNEIPPGLLQIVNASDNTIKDVKEKIESASGDPRDVPVVAGEGGAQWLDMGGTAVNLNIIEEQRWFFFLCLGALGLGKQELGFVEDVNRSNGEVEASRVYKRVTGPFINQFEAAFSKVARQFGEYTALGEPFQPTIAFSDPRAERAREQRLREMYQAGGLTLREYVRRRGDADIAEDDERYRVEVNGTVIDYGDHPLWVSKRLVTEAMEGTDPDDAPGAPPEDDEQAVDSPRGESERGSERVTRDGGD